jgi:hypothetical protein
VLEAVFVLLESSSPSRRIFIGSHSPPSLVRRIGPSVVNNRPAALYHPLLYGRCTAPSKKDGGTLEEMTHDYSTPARDDVVMSGQWERSPPSPSALSDHPRHRDAIPTTALPYLTLWKHAATGHRHAIHCALYGLMSMAPSNPHATALERATSTPPPRSRSWREAGFARTAVYSMALCAMPPHVARTVWNACKLPPPWPIKGGAAP